MWVLALYKSVLTYLLTSSFPLATARHNHVTEREWARVKVDGTHRYEKIKRQRQSLLQARYITGGDLFLQNIFDFLHQSHT